MRTSLRLSGTLAAIALLSGLLPAAAVAPASSTVAAAYPLLADSPLGPAQLRDLPAGVILQAAGLTLTQKDLEAEVAKSPAAMQGQLRQSGIFLVEQMASRSLLLREAKAWGAKHGASGQAEGAVIQAYLKRQAASVVLSDAETRRFYDGNKTLFAGLPFDQVKQEIRSYLLGQKQQAAVELHVNTLVQRAEPALDRAWAQKQYRAAIDNPVDKARLSGKPTLVDFGASGCVPCDMMAPILESLRREYEGKANVIFVHVGEQQVLASRYGIRAIPVQVFFDRSGQEVSRHVGFFAEDDIKAKLREAGVK